MSQHDADRIRKSCAKYTQKCGIHILALCALRNNFHDRCANQNDKGKWHGNADPVERCTYLLLHSFYLNSNEELEILRARIRLFPVITAYSNFFCLYLTFRAIFLHLSGVLLEFFRLYCHRRSSLETSGCCKTWDAFRPISFWGKRQKLVYYCALDSARSRHSYTMLRVGQTLVISGEWRI